MTWLPSEYLLKGIFLGLLLFAALSAGADPWAAGRVGLWQMGQRVSKTWPHCSQNLAWSSFVW